MTFPTPRTVRTTRRVAALALASMAALAAGGAWAQAGATVRLIVGYAPGGPVDTAARQFAPLLSRELGGQPVVVENKAGAAGALGGDLVAKAPAAAPVFFFAASPTLTISPHILKTMPFDPVRDLTPVAPLLSYANLLVANKEQPFKTVAELVAYAKANPGKVTYGSAGIGASNHLSGELFAKVAGVQLTHVPYKGNAPAMTDVIGGQISMMFDIVGTGRNYVASGRVRALAVTSRERNAALPDVPTMREAGLADFEVIGWFGLFGPPRMAADDVKRMNEAALRALASPEMKAKLAEQGYDGWSGTPQQLADRLAKDLALWATVTQGIKVE